MKFLLIYSSPYLPSTPRARWSPKGFFSIDGESSSSVQEWENHFNACPNTRLQIGEGNQPTTHFRATIIYRTHQKSSRSKNDRTILYYLPCNNECGDLPGSWLLTVLIHPAYASRMTPFINCTNSSTGEMMYIWWALRACMWIFTDDAHLVCASCRASGL